jgi:hypothetical protein
MKEPQTKTGRASQKILSPERITIFLHILSFFHLPAVRQGVMDESVQKK